MLMQFSNFSSLNLSKNNIFSILVKLSTLFRRFREREIPNQGFIKVWSLYPIKQKHTQNEQYRLNDIVGNLFTQEKYHRTQSFFIVNDNFKNISNILTILWVGA